MLFALQPAAAGSAPAEDNARPKPLAAALVTAIREGDVSRLSTLLGDGADVNARDPEGNTPLILAGLYAQREIAVLGLKSGPSRAAMPIRPSLLTVISSTTFSSCLTPTTKHSARRERQLIGSFC
jgi:ankyrin repeat protein